MHLNIVEQSSLSPDSNSKKFIESDSTLIEGGNGFTPVKIWCNLTATSCNPLCFHKFNQWLCFDVIHYQNRIINGNLYCHGFFLSVQVGRFFNNL